ncbi:MAG TPA: hypothetical protein H9942_00660 [Candidatus Acutalibacter ornithocaccae]|uniref:Uncharacterized protein n=1 Tax=Candidatus Acutalibacter ornithocaccae TaxID=2838416 RepID=A0A9D2LXH9_9FIRM|nr:hypothetical protein [Candidatus Acutalibacter ornithocaccae]
MGKVTLLSHLKSCAEAAKNFANGLAGQITQAVTEALEEMESLKADKPARVAIEIPTTGWVDDGTGDYPHHYDISASGVTAADKVDIVVAPDSAIAALHCDFCPSTETLAGIIRIRAMSTPTSTISAEYWVTQGKEV